MPNSKNITFDQLQSALTRVKNSLDKKANTSHGNHVPKTETANNARFLRNDNTWQTITPVNIGAADRSHNHTSLTGVTSLQFAAGSSDSAVMKVTTESANTYLDFEMNDDAGSDMYRWRFSAYDTNGATPYFNLMTLTAKDTTSARLTVNGDVTASSFTGNATSATKLQSARALKIGNTSKNFDGTGNITWTLSEIGAAASSHGTHVTYATAVPLADGTAAVGTSSKVAREDHVHPLQTAISGNAGTATKLATARTLTIGNKGKTFDGSSNVSWSLSEIGAASSGHTHNYLVSRSNVTAETGTARPAVDGLSMAHVYDNGYPTTYGNVITLKGQGDGQILVGWSGNSGGHAPVYVRSKRDVADANWSGWAQFYTSANPQTSVSGNAGTATKLQTGRTFTIGNTERTFDGQHNVAWSLNDIGAAPTNHSHNYVPLSSNSSTTIKADSDASSTEEYAQLQAGHNYLRVTSSGGGGTATQGADKLTFNGNVVYHAGYKPSASAIGALPLSGGTMTGPITSSHVTSTWLEGSQGKALLASNAGAGSYVALLRSVSNNGYFTLSSYQNNIYLNYQSKASVDAGTNSVTKQASLLNESGDTSFPGTVTASSFSGYLSGNASSATKLANARNIKIGNTSRSFNGTADVTWTLADIGAAASSHSHSYLPLGGGTVTGNITFSEVTSTTYPANSSKITWNGSTDGADIYYRVTASDKGQLVLNLRDDADATIGIALNGSVKATFDTNGYYSGTVNQANTLATARTLTIGNTGKSFNGSGNVSWSLSEIGAASSGHTHNKILDGNNAITIEQANDRCGLDGKNNINVATWYGFSISNNCSNYDNYGQVTFSVDARSGQVWARGTINAPTFSGSLSGNASSATKLATARAIKIGNTSRNFDGTGNVTWTLGDIGAASSGHNHGLLHNNFTVAVANTTTDNGWSMINSSYNGYLLKSIRSNASAPAWLQGNYSAGIAFGGEDTKGVMSLAYNSPSIRFAGGNGTKPVWYITIDGTSGKTYNMDSLTANTANTANTATKLATARTLTIGNTGKTFDGSGNVSWSLSEIGAASSSHGHSNMLTFKSNHAGDWTDATSMKGKVYMGGWHGNITDSSKTKGYISLALNSGAALDIHLDGDYYANENNLVLNTGNYKTYVTPANIGAANASHGTHVTYGGNGSATTVSRSDHTHSYIPLGGSSSITGNLEFSNSGTTVRGVIGTMGDNDFWRIVGGATANNSGYLEIATADDGNEPIYVRQYSSGKFVTLGRTATLLDGSGNTSFPGTVTAPTFKGALNGNASTATKLQTARKINDIAFDGSADKTIPLKTFGSYVGSDNTKNYHRILSSGNVTGQFTDKSITLMASSDYADGAYGIVRIQLRINNSTTVSSGRIEWIVRKGFNLDSIVFNIKNTAGATIMDVFYKSPETYACVTWTVLGEGVRDGRNGGNGGYGATWTKYNTAAGSTETYTADTMKTIASYTSTMNQGTDVAHVNTSAKLNTARSINGTNFNGTANITTANWGTARTLTVGNTGKSVNGGGNVSWSIDEIGALKASKLGGTDVNTLKTTGRYFIKGTPTNAPTSNHGVIDVAWDLGTPYQIYYPDNANTAYKRTWNNSNSTWSGWTQLKFTDTNTWRGVQNNLTSDATDQSLSAAQGKALKGLIDGKAASSHEHNYLNVKGTNTINSTANDTTANWGAQGNSVHWYAGTEGLLHDQPSSWGYLVNIGQSSEVHQIWMTQASGDLLHRGGNGSGWSGSWRTILDSSNYNTWAAAKNHTHNYAASNHTHNYAGSSSSGGNANAAVKLATARSINGTNFDGSGNITTANWGTGRTITIGNKGKTVNGSGNVSWSLSEIGALPTAGGTVSGNLAVSGAFSVGGKKITINSSAPSSPAVGDIWIKI